MAPHKFTTPRVVYLGQAYGVRDDREPRNAPRAPGTSDRPASDRLSAHRVAAASRSGAR